MPNRKNDIPRVLRVEGEIAANALEAARLTEQSAIAAIDKAEAALKARGRELPKRKQTPIEYTVQMPALRSWDQLLAEAEAKQSGDIGLEDILSIEEIEAVNSRLDGWSKEFAALHRLTSYDYAVSGVAGLLGGLADVFLVKVPAHPGFMGGQGSEGGWLSNKVKDTFGQLLPEEKIKELEELYKVPYDASTNSGLDVEIPGLSPRSHRLHSLGHDPILGWIFGVWDIFNGSFTAIGKDGRTITQTVGGQIPVDLGWDIFQKIIEALKTVGGHMASDVATPAGLPPPLFVLLQFLQFGDIKGRTIAELSRAMYRSGYDFRHFLAGGLCVALIEAIVRVAWFARERHEGKTLMEALPVGNIPRLRANLFLAHATAAAVNAGKVAITKDPLSVSWAQWLAFFRYMVPQAHWTLLGKENARHKYIEGKLDDGWGEIEGLLREYFQGHGPDRIML